MNKSPAVIFHLMLFAASSSMAMSLGRHRGPALIGKPLDISVQAVLDAQDDLAGLCLEADVFYAESKVDSSRVRVGLMRTSPVSTDAVITIRSSTLIDEPVVTVYLRSGCQQKNERRYVLLADLVSDAAGQGAISSSRNGLIPSEFPVALAPSIVSRSGPVAADSSALPQSSRPPTPRQARTVLQKPSAESNLQLGRLPVGADRGRARLKLEPLDLSIDRSPSLRASPELLSVPAASEQERSAAAALWKALTAQPEDILKNTERLRELESSVASLRAELQKNKRSINELTVEVSKAQSERYVSILVYSLLAALLIALAGIAFLWRKQNSVREDANDPLPWWRKLKLSDKERVWDESAPGGRNGAVGRGTPSPDRSKLDRLSERPDPVDLDIDLGGDELTIPVGGYVSISKGRDSRSSLPSRDRPDFAMSIAHMSRAVKAEELFDVQQQADFFVSLGQHEQAIEVLREHINGNVQTSALVYLDLFNLYHLVKRENDYEKLRGEFSELFNARMPEFSLYSDVSSGLEAYPAALDRIVTIWRSPNVLDVIEESIFRKIDAHSEAFDLGAYRELLLLYAIAKEVAGFEPGDATARTYALVKAPLKAASAKLAATPIQASQASASGETTAGEELSTDFLPVVSVILPKPSPRLGLDVDLSDVFGEESAIGPGAEGGFVIGSESDSYLLAQFTNESTTALLRDPKDYQLPSLKVIPDADALMDFENFDALILPSRRL